MRRVARIRKETERMRKFRQKNYPRKRNRVKAVVNYSRLRYKSISPLIDTDDFAGGEFYWFFGDFETNKERWPEATKLEIERHVIIYTCSNDTHEWQEAQAEYGN